MPLTIGTNVASLQVQRRLGSLTESVNRSYERLSSGLRIYRASDDAAGLAIAKSLNVDTRIQTQAIRNVNDGLSALSIAEGALNELGNIVTRQIELAEQAANGTFSVVQRRALDREANALVDEYNRISSTVSMNGINLFTESIRIQAGYGTAAGLTIDPGSFLADEVGTHNFGGPTDLSTGTPQSRDARIFDMNGDGFDDIVATNWSDGSVSVLISNGNGTFKAPLSIAVTGQAAEIELADLNGDGNMDIVTRGAIASDTAIVTILGNGNGTFKAVQYSSSATTTFYHFDLADFNNDGNLDFVGGHAQAGVANGIAVVFGTGTGTFTNPVSFYASYHSTDDFEAADFNGDGNMDLLYIEAAFGETHLAFGNGNGTFRDVGLGYYSDIMAIDINHDGYADIVRRNGASTLETLYGSASGTFTPGMSLAFAAAGGGNLRSLDADDDGWEDLVTFNQSGVANIWFNNGNGTFTAAQSLTIAANTYDVAVGDLVGDGASDLLFASNNASALRIFEQTGETKVSQKHMSLLSAVDARAALDSLKDQLSQISLQQGLAGASQSRLTAVASVLEVTRLLYMTAESQISDVDVASETALLVSRSIQQKAAAALLAQANNEQRIALDLIGGARRR